LKYIDSTLPNSDSKIAAEGCPD